MNKDSTDRVISEHIKVVEEQKQRLVHILSSFENHLKKVRSIYLKGGKEEDENI